jgi:hypothetical protein
MPDNDGNNGDDDDDDKLKPLGEVLFSVLDDLAQRAVAQATKDFAEKSDAYFKEVLAAAPPAMLEGIEKTYLVEITPWEMFTLGSIASAHNYRRVEESMEDGACGCTLCTLKTVLPTRFIARAIKHLDELGAPRVKGEHVAAVNDVRHAAQEAAGVPVDKKH